MLNENFRPWGELSWLLSKSKKTNWNIIGSISFEERCNGLYKLIENDLVNKSLFLDIIPPTSPKVDAQKVKLTENKLALINMGLPINQIHESHLLTGIDQFISPIRKFVSETNGNIMLDISTMPKRFFFPILKVILKSQINNLIVTYTKPDHYFKGELSWDPSDWSHIPSFMSSSYEEPQPDLAIIAAGFMPLGLPKLLTGNYQDAEVKLLFPHPPGPPHYQRNWEFVRKIVDSYSSVAVNEMSRIHALDTSEAFDTLMALTNWGKRKCILAPYGPKPISLAMALFAIKLESPVYYTQPTYYSPEYSSGINSTFGYWIINNGKNLYD